MLAYRRFVTYLFRYEHAIKGANCGFAKVEARQELCKMEIQIKSFKDGAYAVYLFAKTGSGIEGIHIGDIRVRNGMGRENLLFAAESVGDTPHVLDDLGGIYITVDESVFIASQWNDEEVQWNSFRVYEKRAEKNEISETYITEESHIIEGGITQEHVAGGISCQDVRETSEQDVTENVKLEEGAAEKKESKKHVTEEGSESGVTNFSETHLSELTEKEAERLNMKEAHDESRSCSQEFSEMKATQAAASPQISYYMTAWERQWQRFTALHPVFQPFDEEPNIYAIKMELRDFKALPKQYWSLANNSFLLHGYFNYKYLLFGYMDGEEKRWFLGVPGSFQNQEQLLAGIFGFPEFKTKHLTKQRTGEFGFWYRYLEL